MNESAGTRDARRAAVGRMPVYRVVLVLICLLLGVVLTGLGIFLGLHVGLRAGIIACGGLNFLLMAALVYFQRVKS